MIEHYLQAAKLSEEAHRDQVRKGTDIAYFSHPLAVSAMVLGYGGDYSQAMGGLCHDILEDCGPEYRDDILRICGQDTLDIVLDCSDCIKGEGPKIGWFQRKLEYVEKFHMKKPMSFLVVCCDKLHNSGSTITEHRNIGFKALQKFRAPPEMVCWYFVALASEIGKGADLGYLPQQAANDLTANAKELIAMLMGDPRWNGNTAEQIQIDKVITSLFDMLESKEPLVCQLPEGYFK